jgi:hypothetical protein
MMGIITENKKVEVLRNMIDKMGLYQASKMVGGYDELKSLVNRQDKINFINDLVKKVDGSMVKVSELQPNDTIRCVIRLQGISQVRGKYGIRLRLQHSIPAIWLTEP